jgi:preprotein translocase subunit SecY
MTELFAMLLPILIDLINRKIKDTDIRFWVSVVICVVIGVLFNFFDTSFDFLTPADAAQSISNSIIVVFGIAQLSYKAIWENLKIRKDLDLKAPDS